MSARLLRRSTLLFFAPSRVGEKTGCVRHSCLRNFGNLHTYKSYLAISIEKLTVLCPESCVRTVTPSYLVALVRLPAPPCPEMDGSSGINLNSKWSSHFRSDGTWYTAAEAAASHLSAVSYT